MNLSFKPNRLGKLTLLILLVIIIIIAYKKRDKLKSIITLKAFDNKNNKTWDVLSDKRIDTLHPSIRSKASELLITAENTHGIKLRITSALRTWGEQTVLYNQGRTSPGNIVTNAKAGQSYHNYGLAFDVVEMKNGKALWTNPNWAKIGGIGKVLGFSWGGDWKRPDKPHFQMSFGKKYSELAMLYRQGKRNGNYIILT